MGAGASRFWGREVPLQQFLGTPSESLPVVTSAPSANGVGVALSHWAQTIFGGSSYHRRFLATLVVPSGSATFTLYCNTAVAPASAAWGLPIDSVGNQGLIAGGATLTSGTYFFVIEDVAPFTEILLLQTTKSGSPVCTCTMAPLVEKQEGR